MIPWLNGYAAPGRDRGRARAPRDAPFARARAAPGSEHAAQHARGVGIEDRRVDAERERRDGARRVATDAGEALELLGRRGKAPAMALRNLARRAPQVLARR